MAPQSSKMKSSVKPKASRSELSMASASSIVLDLPSASSQIWEADKQTVQNWNGNAHSTVHVAKKSIWSFYSHLKGVCHEIFTSFFMIWTYLVIPVKQIKLFSNVIKSRSESKTLLANYCY